jgi:adenine-specific DNA-methyltransferase
MAPTSILYYKDVGHSQEGAQEVVSLFGDKGVFDGPKPIRLLQRLITLANLDEDSIVLDFFSGSATTAHALMKYNVEKNMRCKFLLVQLPEPINEKTKQAGYKNICEIGKERIRRAGDKIEKELAEKQKAESPDLFSKEPSETQTVDTGFKVFKLASSNIKKWNPDYEHLDESLWQSVNSFVDGRTELDAVYEIMLKMGQKLTHPVEEKELAGKKVYSVARGILIICLDKDITTDLARAVVELQKTTGVEEMRVVFNDAGFKDDVAKTNCKEILKQGGIQEFVTI